MKRLRLKEGATLYVLSDDGHLNEAEKLERTEEYYSDGYLPRFDAYLVVVYKPSYDSQFAYWIKSCDVEVI